MEQERCISIVKYDAVVPQQANATDQKVDGAHLRRLAWADQKTLFVTKGDTVKVCKIKRRGETPEALRLKDLPEYFVAIKSTFK